MGTGIPSGGRVLSCRVRGLQFMQFTWDRHERVGGPTPAHPFTKEATMMRAQLKRKLIVTLALPTIGLSASVALAAGDSYDKTAPRATSDKPPATASAKSGTQQQAMNDMRASELISMKVHNPQGEDLGEVKDLIVDTNNERVHYAVLSFGGIAGLGDKHFAFPVSMFTPDADGKKLTLKVDKEKLKGAPGFARDRWPDWNSDTYHAELDRELKQFGAKAHPQAPSEHLARASDLIGKNVKDRDGKKVGEMQDLVVDLGKGRVHYAVLDFDKAWSTEDKLLPISLKSFHLVPKERRMDLVLNKTREQIDMSHSFAKSEWPDINDPAYQRNVDAYLGQSQKQGVAGQPGPVMNK
jgi:sporulation protein YlmC with PRC-barrel domain